MNCPRCKAVMLIYELEGVEIDHCEECDGIWLDAGELEILLGKSADKVMLDFKIEKRSKEKKLRCPACHKKMQKILCGETRLDKCPDNHGIWFDSGELKEIIARGDIEHKILDLLDEMFKKVINKGE